MMKIYEESYVKCSKLKQMDLNNLYDTADYTLLDYNLTEIINTEAPITFNLVKERLREAFNVKKISNKALDIILLRLKALGFVTTDNLYDTVYWPKTGDFYVSKLRVGYQRQIYDICIDEMRVLSVKLIEEGLSGEALYRAILSYFGYEVLTEKALNYLKFIEENSND